MKWLPITVLAALTKPSRGFGIPSHIIATQVSSASRFRVLQAKGDDEDVSKGMEDAFKQLEGLKALGDGSLIPDKKKQDEAFAKAMDELDLKDVIPPPLTPEKEVKLYEDMVAEVADKDDEDLYSDVLADISGKPKGFTKPSLSKKMIIPDFDPKQQGTEDMMNKALEEALAEAKARGNVEINTESLLNDKDIMKEIETIFDRANDQLMAGLQEIRTEQQALAERGARDRARESQEKMEEDTQRLNMAEQSMKRMMEKVSAETKVVEEAIKDLEEAQASIDKDAVGQLVGLKSGGIVKQGALVGALLFSVRSFAEGVGFFAGDSSHLLPAVLQAAIAVVCLIAFRFL